MAPEPGREWPQTLDVAALQASGWRPVPFQEFVVKIHSRCDLSCDYCYMYQMADQSWREQPRRMPAEVVKQTARRIGEHARAHGLDTIRLILHGGEPLLAGPELISGLVQATRDAAGPLVRVDARVQTNGVGLDEHYLRLFSDLNIQVGVSMDGGAQAHDRHRRFASGRGSYAAVEAGVRRLIQDRFRHLFNGLLCTVDLRNDPVATYEALVAFNPPAIDFLLPHGTWETPPPDRVPGADDAPYADWLIAIFDHWYATPRTRIRLFDAIMQMLLGGSSPTDVVGLGPATVVVIETDGSIEQVDTLKAAYDGAPLTGLHVTRDSLNEALLLPGVAARQIGVAALADECRTCTLQRVCGGGLYTHRYRQGSGFKNPSVYCPDLMRLIHHIRRIVQADVDAKRG